MSRPALEVADIFRDHGPSWRDDNRGHVSLDQLKVMSAIERCRTAELGGHVEALATIFGLWTAILPLLIWAAWSADVFYAVLLSGAVSTTLYAIFAIATAPNVSESDLIKWKQRRTQYENKHAVPRKSTWRDIA